MYLIFLETRIIHLHFPADSLCLSSFIFFLVGAATSRKTFLFLKEGRFRRSRSSKVDKFGANRERICDFLLVRYSNFGHILHHFGAPARFMCSWPHPYLTLILGVFPLHQIAHVKRQRAHYSAVKLFSKNSNIFVHGTWSLRTDGQTDRQTTYFRITALCASIAR